MKEYKLAESEKSLRN